MDIQATIDSPEGRGSIQAGVPRAGRRAAEHVYAALREEIVGLRLKPGEAINRLALQERFGLSSTPIRDALMRLSEEGLVEIVAQSATRVSPIDIGKAREIQFLRRALEQEAVEVICRSAERSVVLLLRDLIAAQKAAASDADLVRFDALDREFHRRIFEAAGAASLHDMMRRQSGHIDRIRLLHLPQAGRTGEIIADHEAVTRHMASGDHEAARQAMRDHLSRSLAYVMVLRERHPGLFADVSRS